MKICDIIFNDEYIHSDIDIESEFNSLTTRASETCKNDILFIPNSLNCDISKCATPPLAVICDPNLSLPSGYRAIRVTNPRLAMARAFYRYNHPNLENIKLIGITGTNGKGGTAEFIKTVLMNSGYKVGLIGTGKIEIMGDVISNKYYSMTTPDPDLLYRTLAKMANENCDVIIMEVSSHALSLDKLEPLVFDYGVFTNLSREHMDFHGDMKNYFSSKAKLFSMCKCGVFNIDDEYGRRAYELCKQRRISVGILWKGDVWANNIENNGLKGINYTYHQENLSFKMLLGTAGIYNAYNSMLAAAVCIDMGCRPCEVKRILGEIKSLPGRFEIINDEISVIIDYAHTDVAFKSVMRELSAIKSNNKLTVIFGCGGNRDKEKRSRMARIAEKYADRIIVTSDNSRNENAKSIISDIVSGFEENRYIVVEDRREAIRTAILSASDRDIVAVIGKGCEKYYIDQSGYHDYSELETINHALAERRSLR